MTKRGFCAKPALPVLSHRPNVSPACEAMCQPVAKFDTQDHGGQAGECAKMNLGHLSCSPLLSLSFSLPPPRKNKPIPLSFACVSLSSSYPHSLASLALSPKLAQLPISPPAAPPAVCPPRTRSPKTIWVTGQEKEQAAFTMDQWRPARQSLPFSPPLFLRSCQDWKRQTFLEK